MNKRQSGRETWNRLLEWDTGQTASERLAGHILRMEGFQSIDPTHPLGGRDSGKDLFAVRDRKKWTGAVYFPRGKKPFSEIKNKFLKDLKGVEANDAQGIAFVTNQELKDGDRKKLTQLAGQVPVEIFHLERVASLLDSPAAYGIRLEFLDLQMTREEQVAFVAWHENERNEMLIGALYAQNQYLTDLITGGNSYPSTQLCAHFQPARQQMGGTLLVNGDHPLLDVVIQVKMAYPEKGRTTVINGWTEDVSVPALYPRGYYNLKYWRVHLDYQGKALSHIDLHVRARNGWFVQRFKLQQIGDETYAPCDQVLYEIMGDEFMEDTWRVLRKLPSLEFKAWQKADGP